MGERVSVRRLLGASFAVALAAGVSSSAARASELPIPLVTAPPTPLAPPLPVPERATAEQATIAAAPGGDALVGVFTITAGGCAGRTSTGSTFRMIQPGGTATGPFLANSDSPCGDQTVTPLAPGSDGGLSTAAYQPDPARAFDGVGNGTAAAITKPQKFMGVAFAVSTNAKDPQTGAAVAKPAISNSNGKLSGDVRAISVAYNNQHFNQGSPKPDGSRPGLTRDPTGTYDPATGAFVVDWTSTIVGGPFNGFTGRWHLEGTFRPAASSAAAPAASAGGETAAPADGVSASAPAPSSAAPATHPNTGAGIPPALGFAFLVVGACGLALRRRIASLATAAPVIGSEAAAPAAGRARRP